MRRRRVLAHFPTVSEVAERCEQLVKVKKCDKRSESFAIALVKSNGNTPVHARNNIERDHGNHFNVSRNLSGFRAKKIVQPSSGRFAPRGRHGVSSRNDSDAFREFSISF
jgi:hypothetical protein